MVVTQTPLEESAASVLAREPVRGPEARARSRDLAEALEEFILIDGPPTERYWSPAVKATIGEHYTGELLAEDPTTALRSRTMTRISDASH